MFFLCRLIERKSFFYASYFNWSLTSPVILDTRACCCRTKLIPQWSTSIVAASKEEKRASPFSSSTPRRKKTKWFCNVWASKLAESDKGSYYKQEKWLKDDKASEKPIETTAKSSCTSFLASGASFLGCEAAKRATNSRQVPRHIKIGRRTFLKVYQSGISLNLRTGPAGHATLFN